MTIDKEDTSILEDSVDCYNYPASKAAEVMEVCTNVLREESDEPLATIAHMAALVTNNIMAKLFDDPRYNSKDIQLCEVLAYMYKEYHDAALSLKRNIDQLDSN